MARSWAKNCTPSPSAPWAQQIIFDFDYKLLTQVKWKQEQPAHYNSQPCYVQASFSCLNKTMFYSQEIWDSKCTAFLWQEYFCAIPKPLYTLKRSDLCQYGARKLFSCSWICARKKYSVIIFSNDSITHRIGSYFAKYCHSSNYLWISFLCMYREEQLVSLSIKKGKKQIS